jgi:cytochrome P450
MLEFNIIPPWWSIACLPFAAIVYVLLSDVVLWRRMPPGPRPLPFIGNKFDIPKRHPWIQFQKWSKQYGPFYTLWMGRSPNIIISDPNVAVELLEKRSIKYSSRPRFVTMGEIYWDMATILVQPYGKDWSVRRKLLHQALTPRALQFYKPVQEAESCRLCYHLLTAPESWEKSLDRLTASIVFSISYGHRIDSLSSPVIRQRMDFMQYAASLNVPGAYLVESIPALKYLPNWLAPWKVVIQKKGRHEAAVNMQLVRDVQQDIANAKDNAVPDSLTKQLLEARDADPGSFSLLSERDFSFIPASLFGAGADTTASTLCSAFLAIVTNQDTLKAAHAELDSIIGDDRLPSFDGESSLPYIRAFCKEVLRWRPVAVLGGTPHANTAPDNYQGYSIPVGTNVLGNSWAINLNEEYYPSPDSFNPLRFLDTDPSSLAYLSKSYVSQRAIAKGKPHPSKLGHSSFGWGRRICPGADLASNTLFIALARLLWTFDILPVKGKEYDTLDYTDGFNIRPRSFECVIRVRSEKHREVLKGENQRAEDIMARFPVFKEQEIQV